MTASYIRAAASGFICKRGHRTFRAPKQRYGMSSDELHWHLFLVPVSKLPLLGEVWQVQSARHGYRMTEPKIEPVILMIYQPWNGGRTNGWEPAKSGY